jgi:Fe-S-cluster containining protein
MFKILFLLLRVIVIVDYYLEDITKKIIRPKYKKTGKCIQCTQCCNLIALLLHKSFKKRPFLLKIIIIFYERINDFKYISFSEEDNVLFFTCNKFDKEKKKCMARRLRPAICRHYPYIKFFEKPDQYSGCGYSIIER